MDEAEDQQRQHEERQQDNVVRKLVLGRRGRCLGQQPPSRWRRERARAEEARRKVHSRVRRHGHCLRRLQHAQVHPQRHGALHLAVGLSKGKPCLFRQSYYKLGSVEGS